MSEKKTPMTSLFRGRKGWLFWGGGGGGGLGVGCEGGGCGSRYADIICVFCTRNEPILPFMSAKMSWMSSPNSIKHVQVICKFNSYTDYYNLTHEVITLECPVI